MVGVGLAASDFRSLIPWPKLAGPMAPAIVVVWALLSFAQSGYWVDSSAFLLHTIEVNPGAAAPQNNLGKILLQQDQVEEAIEHLRKALAIEPDDAEAQNNLGLALERVGQIEEAARCYQKALQISPRYVKAYENLAKVYLQTQQFEAAIGSLKMAVAIQPDAKAFNDLGVAFMHTGRPNEGLDAFRRAVEFEPDNARYRKNLGIGLIQLGRTDEARAYLAP
jgi:Flp pilus assembly protein TadD